MCLTRDLPLTIQSCVLPTDCKLTDWTIWSPCTKTCMNPESPRGNRTRTRQVLQFPVGEGAECPLLEEFESCEPQGESIPPCATWVTPDDREEMQGAQVGVSRDLKKHWVKCRCGIHSMVHNRSSCFTGIELHVMLWWYPPLISWLRKIAGIHIRLRHKYSEPKVFGIQPDWDNTRFLLSSLYTHHPANLLFWVACVFICVYVCKWDSILR